MESWYFFHFKFAHFIRSVALPHVFAKWELYSRPNPVSTVRNAISSQYLIIPIEKMFLWVLTRISKFGEVKVLVLKLVHKRRLNNLTLERTRIVMTTSICSTSKRRITSATLFELTESFRRFCKIKLRGSLWRSWHWS